MVDNTWQLFCADSKHKLKDFPDNYFDSCVMDGPYGFRFMGKPWDTFDIEKNAGIRKTKKSRDPNSGRNGAHMSTAIEAGKYNQSLEANRNFQNWFYELATEVYRVLKPGAYFLSFGGPRTAHRMISGIEDAGFEIRDVMTWMFASGFPKSHNLKEYGVGTALKPAYEPIVMARKPLEGTVEENFNKWGTGVLHIEKSRVPGEPWKFGTQTDIRSGKYADSRPSDGDVFRKDVIGGELGRWPANLMHDGSAEVVALFPESKGQLADVKGTEPSLPTGSANTYSKMNRIGSRGKRNDSGSAARFFHEFKHDEEDLDFIKFIFNPKTSRKDRNEGIDNTRWFYDLELVYNNGSLVDRNLFYSTWDYEDQSQKQAELGEVLLAKDMSEDIKMENKDLNILSFGSNTMAPFPKAIKFTTTTKSKQIIELKISSYYQHLSINESIQDVIKTNQENGLNLVENAGLKRLLIQIFTNAKMASVHGVKNVVLNTQLNVKKYAEKRSEHPTVKPTALMQYLVKLVTPVGGKCVDPCCGSGSTGKACVLEDIEFYGIDLEQQWIDISEQRMIWAWNKKVKIK